GRRHHGHAAAALGEEAQDVVLDAVVVGDDVRLRAVELPIARARLPAPFGPFVRFIDADHPGEVHAGEAGELARPGERFRLVDVARHQAAVLRALLAQQARELARVDVGDAGNV